MAVKEFEGTRKEFAEMYNKMEEEGLTPRASQLFPVFGENGQSTSIFEGFIYYDKPKTVKVVKLQL